MQTARAQSAGSLLKTHCLRCHDANKQNGDVRLDRPNDLDLSTLNEVYDQITHNLMPPQDEAQPSDADRKVLADAFLSIARKLAPAAPAGMRRLNRREYGNTVKDLLGLRDGTFDPAATIFADEVADSFDTNADALVISNQLLLEYMDAADDSLRQALFSDSPTSPPVKVLSPVLAKMGGTSRRSIDHSKNHVICRSGGGAKLHDGKSTRELQFPGLYKITVTACGVDRDNYEVPFIPKSGPIVMGFGVANGPSHSYADVTLKEKVNLQDNVDQTFTFETWIDNGYFPFVSFPNGPSKPITQIRQGMRRGKVSKSTKDKYMGPGIRVSEFRIEGPFHEQWPPESFVTTYGTTKIPNLKIAKERDWMIGRFALRAYRRPVTREEMEIYLAFLQANYAKTKDWHEATIRTLTAMMSSPEFLYIHESTGKLNNFELASRLSYFFWSTMPDAELFSLASAGKLSNPSVLAQQVGRMLDDPRSKRFCDSFSDQWLSLDELGSMPPDTKGEFREYYKDNLEQAMLEETHRFFRHVLMENQSVGDFIDGNYSFINASLAQLYGVPYSKQEDGFTHVTFPPNAKRGGLLGHGSILTLTSNGVETTPVERGVWVLRDLMGTPPPPPPAEVPAITPDLNGSVTVRDMLEKHRSDAACMECHRRMDPLGFALEAFDPIGRYRTKYSKLQLVSTQGNYLGSDFRDVIGLKQILSRDLRPFARNLIVRIAEYAKGRELVVEDQVTVNRILGQSDKNDFRFKDMVKAIAESELMTQR